ncbi:hypothetical protein EDC96DRAFT_471291, partial [Choanephora cucurbitarum]
IFFSFLLYHSQSFLFLLVRYFLYSPIKRTFSSPSILSLIYTHTHIYIYSYIYIYTLKKRVSLIPSLACKRITNIHITL